MVDGAVDGTQRQIAVYMLREDLKLSLNDDLHSLHEMRPYNGLTWNADF